MKKILFLLAAIFLFACGEMDYNERLVRETLTKEFPDAEVLSIERLDTLVPDRLADEMESQWKTMRDRNRTLQDSLQILLKTFEKVNPDRLRKLDKEQRRQLLSPIKEVLLNQYNPSKDELYALNVEETTLRVALDSVRVLSPALLLKYRSIFQSAGQKDTAWVYVNPQTQQVLIPKDDLTLLDLGDYAVVAAQSYASLRDYFLEKNNLLTQHNNTVQRVLENIAAL